MLPHLKPKCIKYFIPELSLLFDAGKILSLFAVVVLLFRKKKLPSPVSWVLGILEGWICLRTFATQGDYVQTCALAVSVMGISLLVDLYSDRMREVITTFMFNFEWLVYANLLSVLYDRKNGLVLDQEYDVAIFFFGPSNWLMYLSVPALCVAALYLRLHFAGENRGRHILRTCALMSACGVCLHLQRPVTAQLSALTFLAVLLVSLIPVIRYCATFPPVFLVGIGANLAITVLQISVNNPVVYAFVRKQLNKPPSLHGRTRLWEGIPALLGDNIWLGIGTPAGGYLIKDRVYDHMHNQYFDLLTQGGILALILFFALLLLCGIQLTRRAKLPAARIMTAAMGALLVLFIAEACRQPSVFLLFPLAFYADRTEAERPPSVREE